MKSFSLKALALAFVVVAGPAQAGISDMVNTAKNYTKSCVTSIDEKLFGKINGKIVDGNVETLADVQEAIRLDATLFPGGIDAVQDNIEGGFRGFNSYLHFKNGYARAAVVVAVAAGISTAVYKTYKHFTKPAADETTENDNANETTSTEDVK